MSLQLFVFDQVKGFLSPKDGKPGKLASLPVSPVAGSCAGISSTICMYPLELLKTRLTIQVRNTNGRSCILLSNIQLARTSQDSKYGG